MHAFVTYCSARKRSDEGLLPAIRRYQSSRIDRVYAAALQLGMAFFILSGEFGLLSPLQSIPWYDHLLKPDEVLALTDRVEAQIRRAEIARLVYFTQSLAAAPDVIPYHDVMVGACSRARTDYLVVELDYVYQQGA